MAARSPQPPTLPRGTAPALHRPNSPTPGLGLGRGREDGDKGGSLQRWTRITSLKFSLTLCEGEIMLE